MNWTEIFKTLGIFGISATTITFIIGYLGQKYIELVAQKKLEQAKNDLLMQAAEFQIKTSNLHSERFNVMKSLYSKLSELNDYVFILVIAGQGSKSEYEQVDKLYHLYYDLRIDFNKNKILFNKDLSILINDTISKIHSSLFDFKQIIETSDKLDNEFDFNKIRYYQTRKREVWDRAAKLIQKDVPILLEKLETEFREILGVN